MAPIYGPWLGMSLSLGMLTVALPLYLTNVGIGYLSLSAVLTAAGFGSSLGGLPAGVAIARFGPRAGLAFGSAAIGLTIMALASGENVVVLFGLQFMAGVGAVALRLSGQTWIARSVDVGFRGRLLSAMGGTRRFGAFIGPFAAGVIIDGLGFEAAFLAAGAVAGIGVLPALFSAGAGPAAIERPLSLRTALTRHWRLLLLATAGPVLIMAARRGRAVVVPLIGDDLGLSPTAVGLLVSIGTGADLLLFPVSGYLMDNFGRLMAIIPAFSMLGAGLALLAVAGSESLVIVAVALMGIGNGLSAGTMLTLSADIAPEDSTSQFLAGFAALQDWGSVLGPLLVGWVAAARGLGPSAAALAVVVFVGLGLIVRNTGETGAPSPASLS